MASPKFHYCSHMRQGHRQEKVRFRGFKWTPLDFIYVELIDAPITGIKSVLCVCGREHIPIPHTCTLPLACPSWLMVGISMHGLTFDSWWDEYVVPIPTYFAHHLSVTVTILILTGNPCSKLLPTESVQILTIFMVISVFIIVLLCFNYAQFGAWISVF